MMAKMCGGLPQDAAKEFAKRMMELQREKQAALLAQTNEAVELRVAQAKQSH
jgi:hypothetical protein